MTDCKLVNDLRIGSFTIRSGFITQNPFQIDSLDTEKALTYTVFEYNGLLTLDEKELLEEEYNVWKVERMKDPVYTIDSEGAILAMDDIVSVDGCVDVSYIAAGNYWNSQKCYFTEPPRFESLGNFFNTTCKLVDAESLVEARNRQKFIQASTVDYFGVFELWGVELLLRSQPETYQDMPTLQLSAAGKSYTTGPRNPTEVMNIQGDTDLDGWIEIYDKCREVAALPPSDGTDDWFPLSAPVAQVTKRLDDKGVRNDLFTVAISVAKPQI